MKLKSLIISAALLFGLTNCLKENTSGPTPEEESITSLYIKFNQPEATSKADTDEVHGNTPVSFTEGGLFITDDNDDILVYLQISSNNVPGNVSVGDLEDGHLIHEVSTAAKKVYIIGNYNFGSNRHKNMSELKTIYKDILEQTDHNYGVSAASLFGSGPLVDVTTGSNGQIAGADKEAIFPVYPLIARLEIENVKCIDPDVDSYTLSGIYINNFYFKVDILGNLVDGDLYHFGKSPYAPYYANFYRAPAGQYQDTWYRYLFDDGYDLNNISPVGPLGNSDSFLMVEPEEEVWAYNFFANSHTAPHIVLHFTNVYSNVTNDLIENHTTNNDGEAYLTVVGYVDRVFPNGPINMQGGHIYKIRTLEFELDDLKEDPYEDDDDLFTVYVEIKLMPWEEVEVDPIYR